MNALMKQILMIEIYYYRQELLLLCHKYTFPPIKITLNAIFFPCQWNVRIAMHRERGDKR